MLCFGNKDGNEWDLRRLPVPQPVLKKNAHIHTLMPIPLLTWYLDGHTQTHYPHFSQLKYDLP